ncbi:ubiquinol-cytochrome-c reductase complex assembly factor 2-like [Eriocheir sinensis]|uniref:ubiquinol-cytochrome-c reductase complex assembly factor 2-like n=1 Tax=Eriocheir sinensis TaxID=95602 RepID=UPI0021C6FEA3|nr:ubiquinol-cytochrome-c reductase complex assembly factor 2-like [Eriocheir sinensis]
MARNSYRNFLRLLEKWPLDASKSGDRDLGEHIRKRVTEAFKHGEASEVNEEECQRIYTSLNRIASGAHAAKYPRSLTSTSTGLSAEECHHITSTEFLKALEDEDKGVLQRLLKKD